MTLKFEQFKATIDNPTVEVVSVSDNLSAKTCSVDVKLSTSSAEFGVNLNGFTYVDSWEDSDITTWVNSKLTEYAI
jgi:hypothetical protein